MILFTVILLAAWTIVTLAFFRLLLNAYLDAVDECEYLAWAAKYYYTQAVSMEREMTRLANEPWYGGDEA